MRRWPLFLLLLGIVLAPTQPVEAKGTFDRKQQSVITDLATRWFEARPKTYFEKWDRKKRVALLDEARAVGGVPEGSLAEVVELLWKPLRKAWPKVKGKIDTPYGEAWWKQNGSGGPKNGFVLGLHGGGIGAGSASEATKWKLSGNLHFYPQGIRLIHDTWNSIHGERFLLTMIEIAKVQYDVDPDRVFSMGFSMGGTGSWFMAGRHPDLLAGAIPAHGVLMAEGGVKIKDPDKLGAMQHGFVPNARNLAVYFYTGSEDKNCEPGTFLKAWEMIEGYREDDPDGWKDIRFQCHEGIAHTFPPGEPGNGYKFIKDKVRDTFPKTLVWEYGIPTWPELDQEDRDLEVERLEKFWFYWLHCEWPADRMFVRARRYQTEDTNEIEIEATGRVQIGDFTIYLNPEMIDVNRDTVVRSGGKEIWRGRPEPDFETILVSLDARVDRRMVFDRKIRLDEDE